MAPRLALRVLGAFLDGLRDGLLVFFVDVYTGPPPFLSSDRRFVPAHFCQQLLLLARRPTVRRLAAAALLRYVRSGFSETGGEGITLIFSQVVELCVTRGGTRPR